MPPTDSTKNRSISKAAVETLWENSSTRITDKVRALALGIIAFSWAVLSAEKPPVSEINNRHHIWLLITVLFAILSLLIDLLQSLANYVEFNRLRKAIENSGEDYGQFNPKSFLYRFQNAAPWIKTGFCVASCLSLLILVPISL